MFDRLKTYFVKTYGCAMNVVDSGRMAAGLEARGYRQVSCIEEADVVVVNTCMVRRSAEDRVYGLIRNLVRQREKVGRPKKIVVTGCMVGMAVRERSGKMLRRLEKEMPEVDDWLPIEEVGFDQTPLRSDKRHALVPISNGCDNYCSYCVVPYTRGGERSRPFKEVVSEVEGLVKKGYRWVTLVGQNVNSYGADLIKLKGQNLKVKTTTQNSKVRIVGKWVRPVVVRRMGRERVPTLFPYLLEEVAKVEGIEKVDFISSNPWDFSDELIEVIARNPEISRTIHLPVQSGSNRILKLMNRWYTREEYLKLVERIKDRISDAQLTTDIIVGFPGETEEDFLETVDLVRKVGFTKAYIARYSPRPMTAALRMEDDVSAAEKKRRWRVLERLINGRRE